ncbi:MAG: zinc ribbon domain-containing protein [Thermoproteota archaeon]
MLRSKLIEDARKYANYSYFTMLIMGILISLAGPLLIMVTYPDNPIGLLGVFMLLGGPVEVLLAIFSLKPGFVDLINCGMYEDAIQYFDEEKDNATSLVFVCGFLGGLIPAILLHSAANRLALALSMDETSYKICLHCGAKMPSGAKFCGKCGATINKQRF